MSLSANIELKLKCLDWIVERKKSNNWINLTMLLSRFVHLASLVMHKPRQLRIAGYPNVRKTLRAAEKESI